MYVLEESDCAIVPMKLTNNEDKTSAEPVEGRAQTKENVAQPHTHSTQSGARVSQGLGGVRQTARNLCVRNLCVRRDWYFGKTRVAFT
jgi:hypothetical protein